MSETSRTRIGDRGDRGDRARRVRVRARLRAGFALAVLAAATLAAPRALDACHVPVQADYLSAQQASLAAWSHGHGQPELIAYSLESTTACEGGVADIFSCENVDLLAHLPLDEIGGGTGNDVWGWRDPRTGREYALVGRSNGTAFIDMTDPESPVYVGNLPTHADQSAWRDIKVYDNHAYVVADFAGNHGMQVFDLTQLRRVRNPPVEFEETAHYGELARAHNIVVNEETGFAYAVGSETCNGGGLHMIDLADPERPVFAGCFGEDGYTHDAQCVVYRGPDAARQGREICFAANEDSVTIVDVTDKQRPTMLSRNEYQGSGYTHQGWLTEDHAYFLVDDELDERINNHATKTYVWDLSDLTAPTLAGAHVSKRDSIDHNQYVHGDHTYQANYRKGLTILRLTNPRRGKLEEVASFDTYPEADGRSFQGAWSVYPFFDSGAVLVSDINRGLFVLRPRLSGGRIFLDDFESGDLSAWSKRQGPAVEAIAPGLKGSGHALAVTLDDGAAGPSFVTALQPARETRMTASFRLKANQVDLRDEQIEILRFVAPGDRTVVSLTLEQRGNRHWVNVAALDGGELRPIGSTRVPSRKAVLLSLEWEQASADGAADGTLRLTKRGKRVRAEALTLDATRVLTAVRVGLPDGVGGIAASGAFLIDDFELTQ